MSANGFSRDRGWIFQSPHFTRGETNCEIKLVLILLTGKKPLEVSPVPFSSVSKQDSDRWPQDWISQRFKPKQSGRRCLLPTNLSVYFPRLHSEFLPSMVSRNANRHQFLFQGWHVKYCTLHLSVWKPLATIGSWIFEMWCSVTKNLDFLFHLISSF